MEGYRILEIKKSVFENNDREADKLRQDGIYNVNELREKVGDDRIPQPWADEYSITKNMESVNATDPAT